MEHLFREDFDRMEPLFRRNLINGLSGFKSLNLIGSINRAGVTNLAIFSQVFHIGASPALMGVLVRPDSVERHSLQNINEMGWFTFNHVLESFYKQAHQTSARYQQSEFEAVGLTPWYSSLNPAPYVEQSIIRIGLKLEEQQKLSINGTILLIGSVQEVILEQGLIASDGYLDIEKAGTITCSGLDGYHKTTKLGRLSYAKPGVAPEEIN